MARVPFGIDPFLLLILGSAGLAWFAPATGDVAMVLGWATKAAIALLFFGYGARLSARQALAGLTHWRLHLAILGTTFVVFPLVGAGLLALPDGAVASTTWVGLAFLTLVPSTVQSSITFTSIARGNVAGAIVAATTSNVVGVVATPLLAAAVLPAVGGHSIGWGSVGQVAVQLLLPFVLGQASRRWTADVVAAHAPRLKLLDQFVVALVVFGAFSSFRATQAWRGYTLTDLWVMLAVTLVLLAGAFSFTWWLGGRMRFNRADRIALLFCGTKKSLATGVPMASVLFAPQLVGAMVLPLMIFHQAQLMASAVIARRFAADDPPD
ncbi:MAG: bile acid:sodium symporter family protein [Arachnia sp.]